VASTVRFAGRQRTGAFFNDVSVERAEDEQPVGLEDGEPLAEALKAPVVARFASFAGHPSIRGALTWDLARREITISGTRGQEPFQEMLR
jgi:hypothetical protein